PPLRERKDEILALAETFVREASARAAREPPPLSPAARAALLGHAWPGNVRELKATMERALVLSQADATLGDGARAIDLAPRGLAAADEPFVAAPEASERRAPAARAYPVRARLADRARARLDPVLGGLRGSEGFLRRVILGLRGAAHGGDDDGGEHDHDRLVL